MACSAGSGDHLLDISVEPHHPMNTEPRAINKVYFAVQQLPNQTVIATISITGEFFLRVNMEGDMEERALRIISSDKQEGE